MELTTQSLMANLAWFDVADPNSPQLDELARCFGFHELQVEDCRHRAQRAKTEEYESYLFVVLKPVESTNGELEFEDLDVFLGAGHIVTVHAQAPLLLEKVRQRAEQAHVGRPDRLFYILLDTIVDQYLPVLDAMADDISEIETLVLRRPGPDLLADIFRLKRKLIEFRRVTGAMREVVNTLMRREGGLIGDDLDPYLRDVYDHLVRTSEFIETYRDLLTGALDIYLSAVANRTNEIMKVLTIWGTIALPLVIITGFFGMNLHLPWMNSLHGAAYAAGLMLLSTLIILLYFRLKRWM